MTLQLFDPWFQFFFYSIIRSMNSLRLVSSEWIFLGQPTFLFLLHDELQSLLLCSVIMSIYIFFGVVQGFWTLRHSSKRLHYIDVYFPKRFTKLPFTFSKNNNAEIEKTPERHQWRLSGVFPVNFEYISHLFLIFLFLTLSK